jgi:hypothetical protein
LAFCDGIEAVATWQVVVGAESAHEDREGFEEILDGRSAQVIVALATS